MALADAADGWPTGIKTGWKAADLNPAEFTHEFTPDELKVLFELAGATKKAGLAVTDITREHFTHPAVTPMLVDLVRTMKDGPAGLTMIRGLPVHERPLDDIWRVYWGIGTYFGYQRSQNYLGTLQGEVRTRPDIEKGRAYNTKGRLPFHNDRIDILTLLSIYKAPSGGENMFVSCLKVWDIIEQERPDLMPVLRQGFRQSRNGEQAPGESNDTPYRVPIFGEAEGLRSCLLAANAILRDVKRDFPEDLAERGEEALTYLREVIERPEMSFRLQLEPGEGVFINNHEVLHSREDFVDDPTSETRRLLLRMWIEGRPWRPKPDHMLVMRNPSGHQGIDPQPVTA